jgi:hypothetical protein
MPASDDRRLNSGSGVSFLLLARADAEPLASFRHGSETGESSAMRDAGPQLFLLSPVCRVSATTWTPFDCNHCFCPHSGPIMPTAKLRAATILAEFEQAQEELVGKAVILTDGKAGTVERLWLDEWHGLRLSIRGHDGKWPVSTVKFVQTK